MSFVRPSVYPSVRVPATSANLGPGFDALGLALGLHLCVSINPSPEDQFEYTGNGEVNGTDNLIFQAFRLACTEAGTTPPTVRIEAHNPIPLARGLGSSSAALVAGAALGDVVLGGRLGREGVLRLCAKLEGHPDNVAPAVLGGFTASAMRGDTPVCASLAMPAHWQVLVAIPDFELKTEAARRALPDTYGKADMVFNLSRAALWVAAVAKNDAALLREACLDKMHQPHRAPLVPGLSDTIEAALNAGALAAFLSGAGPSLAAVVDVRDTTTLEGVRHALQMFAPEVLLLPVAVGYETAGSWPTR